MQLVSIGISHSEVKKNRESANQAAQLAVAPPERLQAPKLQIMSHEIK
jgi:hypothetical protein